MDYFCKLKRQKYDCLYLEERPDLYKFQKKLVAIIQRNSDHSNHACIVLFSYSIKQRKQEEIKLLTEIVSQLGPEHKAADTMDVLEKVNNLFRYSSIKKTFMIAFVLQVTKELSTHCDEVVTALAALNRTRTYNSDKNNISQNLDSTADKSNNYGNCK